MKFIMFEKTNPIFPLLSLSLSYSDFILKGDFIFSIQQSLNSKKIESYFIIKNKEIIAKLNDGFFNAYLHTQTDLRQGLGISMGEMAIIGMNTMFMNESYFNNNENFVIETLMKILRIFKNDFMFIYEKRKESLSKSEVKLTAYNPIVMVRKSILESFGSNAFC